MELRNLGSTGISVSPIGLGTVKFGRNSGVKYPLPFNLPNEQTIDKLLSTAENVGVNFLDTAPAYGTSEERIGRALTGKRRNWIISTKVGEDFRGGESEYDFSPDAIRRSVCRSLRRLKTDYIDVLLLHSDGRDESILGSRETIDALDDLKRKGIIRATGISVKSVTGGLAALKLSDIIMIPYNLVWQEQDIVIEEARKMAKGVLIKKPLNSGKIWEFKTRPQVEAAIQFVLSNPGVSCAVVGTIRASHLVESVRAAEELEDELGLVQTM